MADDKNDKNYIYRVREDGVTLEVQLGEDRLADGRVVPITRAIVGRAGQVLTSDVAPRGLAPHLEERYDAGEAGIRAAVERVELTEDDDGIARYVVVDQSDEEVERAEQQAESFRLGAEAAEAGRFDPVPAIQGLLDLKAHIEASDDEENDRIEKVLQDHFGDQLDELDLDIEPGEGDGDPGPSDPSEPTEEQKQAAARAQEGVQGTASAESSRGGGVEQFDPSKHNVEEVQQHLDSADDAERQRVLSAEKQGEKRKGILEHQPKEG